jgi:hypothetical protein
MLDAADAPLEVERHQHDVGEFEIGLFHVTRAVWSLADER